MKKILVFFIFSILIIVQVMPVIAQSSPQMPDLLGGYITAPDPPAGFQRGPEDLPPAGLPGESGSNLLTESSTESQSGAATIYPTGFQRGPEDLPPAGLPGESGSNHLTESSTKSPSRPGNRYPAGFQRGPENSSPAGLPGESMLYYQTNAGTASYLPKTACAQGGRLPCNVGETQTNKVPELEVFSGGLYEDSLVDLLLDMRKFLKRAECDLDYFGELKEELAKQFAEAGQDIDLNQLEITELNALKLKHYDKQYGPLCLNMTFPVLFSESDKPVVLLGFLENKQISWQYIPAEVNAKGVISFSLDVECLCALEATGGFVCVLR